MLLRRFLTLVALLAATPVAGHAHGVLRGFVDEVIVGGLTLPVAFTSLPDGRFLVAEKAGVVRVVRDGRLLPDALIDLRARVNDYWDRGLLGLAVDPAFAHNGYVYLFYIHEDDPLTYSGPKTARVTRVTAVGDEADPATEVVLVSGIPADSPSHNGGAMRFGADGALWFTTGDAASFNAVDPRALRTQQLDSLAGKLLRVDTAGRGLPDNPFWNGEADAVRSKVWAYGFRNPFRLTLRPSSGQPYIADVGAHDWEEVNAVVRGGNHGWPCWEGPAPQAGYQTLAECQAVYTPGAVVLPLVAYPHTAGSATITGGAFYTGTAFPDSHRNAYFFGDFSRGTLHHVSVDGPGGADPTADVIRGFATGIDGVVDVQADADGLLYLSVTTGVLRRVRYVPDTGPSRTLYLSDAVAQVTFASNGAGPVELDRSHGALAGGDGGPLTLAGETYAKGLGVQAPSDIRFALAGRCTAFTAVVGIDDETRGAGSVGFEVWLDGVRVVASGIVRGREPALSGTLDVTGRQELRLVVTDGGDGPRGDHADWADARLECVGSGGDDAAPVVVTTSPSADATGVAPDAVVTATFSEAMDPATIGPATVSVVDVDAAVPVAVVISPVDAARQVVVTPHAPWSAGRRYRITIAGGTGGAADVAGNVLAVARSWQFTVAVPETNQPPVPVVASPAPGHRFAVGDVIAFSGGATDHEDGAVPAGSLDWTVSVRHCPEGVCHTHPLTAATGASGSVVAPEHGADSYLVITLKATDTGGRTATASVDVHPRLVDVTLASDPPGLPVIFGEVRRRSPATFRAVVGSHMNVGTLSPQHSLSFTGWTSGRPQTHVLVVGDADTTDTAQFRAAPGVSYLSDLTWAAALNGAGPVERDRSHGDAAGGDGPPITLRGVTYAKGLGVLAASDVRVHVNGACTAFAATLGIDDDVQGGGSVVAGVLVDGRLAFLSGPVTGVMAPIDVAVDLTGVNELQLLVSDGGDGHVNDEVDWADARITCSGPRATAPDAPAAIHALAAGGTAGLWWTPVAGAASYRLEAGSAPGARDLATLDVSGNTLAAVVPPGVFWVRVRALNAWGMSPATPEARLVVDGTTSLPETATALTATVDGQTVSLRWTPPASGGLPADYLVEGGSEPGQLALVSRVPGPALTIAGVPRGTYVLQVRSANAAGTSAPTPIITVVVP